MKIAKKVLQRHKTIKKIVKEHQVEDQEHLVQMLQDCGIDTNQSIVSRDLRQLGISKRNVKDKMVYELPRIDINQEVLRLAVLDVQHNESLIVVKTKPGIADFVGDFIDSQDGLEVIGSLSGENVVFVAPKSTKHIRKIYKQICAVLYFKK